MTPRRAQGSVLFAVAVMSPGSALSASQSSTTFSVAAIVSTKSTHEAWSRASGGTASTRDFASPLASGSAMPSHIAPRVFGSTQAPLDVRMRRGADAREHAGDDAPATSRREADDRALEVGNERDEPRVAARQRRRCDVGAGRVGERRPEERRSPCGAPRVTASQAAMYALTSIVARFSSAATRLRVGVGETSERGDGLRRGVFGEPRDVVLGLGLADRLGLAGREAERRETPRGATQEEGFPPEPATARVRIEAQLIWRIANTRKGGTDPARPAS